MSLGLPIPGPASYVQCFENLTKLLQCMLLILASYRSTHTPGYCHCLSLVKDSYKINAAADDDWVPKTSTYMYPSYNRMLQLLTIVMGITVIVFLDKLRGTGLNTHQGIDKVIV